MRELLFQFHWLIPQHQPEIERVFARLAREVLSLCSTFIGLRDSRLASYSQNWKRKNSGLSGRQKAARFRL